MRCMRWMFGALACCMLAAAVARARDKEAKPASQRAEYKPQSEVASKSAFATVKEDDSAVKKALAAKELAEAKKLIGKDGAFKGTVTKVFSPRGNSMVILDFAPNFKDALTAVLKAVNYAKFPDMSQLKDKKVLISGKFEDYKGAPQIVLEKLEQIRLIK